MTILSRDDLKRSIQRLAGEGILIGTSSWKYPGWRGMLYDEARYIYRGKFNETRLEKNCLPKYAEVFKTTCFDGAYYRFPNQKILESLFSQVPNDFQFAFKVTGEITIKKFP